MIFADYAKEVLRTEITEVIERQGYFFEKEFCSMIHEKYNISVSTVAVTLLEMRQEMSLTKRHLTNELKVFYGLKNKGCPIIYISNNSNINK